jgi:predicted  nucleic acid-binding Zn-ribbon protein
MATKKSCGYSKLSTGSETPFFSRGTVLAKDSTLPPRQHTQEIFLDGSNDDKVARLIEKLIALTNRLESVEQSMQNLASRTSQLNNTTDVMNSHVSDLRPDMRNVRAEMSGMAGRVLALESKVQSVENKAVVLLSRPHECIQEGVIQNMREEAKVLQTDIKQATERIVATATALEKGAEPAVQEIKAARQRFLGLVATIALTVLGGAAGWIATFSALRKDVQHLNVQQQSIETEVTKSREAVRSDNAARDKQFQRLERKVEQLNAGEVGFDEWYHGLTAREKVRLHRVLGKKNLPLAETGD